LFVSIASFTFTIITIIVDKKGDKVYGLNKDKESKENLNREFFDSVLITENTSYRQLPAIYWLTCLFIIFCYGSYLPFNNIASGFLTETFFKDLENQEAEKKAGMYMSIPFIISCFFVPLFGHLVDKFGKRASITLLSSLLGVFGFASFFFLAPIFGFIIIGFSYSLTATVCWNIISVVVKNDAIVIIFYLRPLFKNDKDFFLISN
jgi:nitrate/nitrite transporter NarK